jgi:hypothetical protein
MKQFIFGVIVGMILLLVSPIHSTISVSMYCKEGGLFGCDWDKGTIIKDKLYITLQ